MNLVRTKFHKLVKDTRGANLVEYILLVGIIALLTIAAAKIFNSSVKGKIQQQAGTVAKINGSE
jgi:pilus assembly protein Flp/PilA